MQKPLNILITTPLFPPETDNIANYSKILAESIATDYKVTILTYANHPLEANGYLLLYVKKNQNFLHRVFSYLKILFKIIDEQDTVILQSGISAALPTALVAKLKKKKIICHFFEDEVTKRKKIATASTKLFLIKFAQKIVLKLASSIICSTNKLQKKLIGVYQIPADKIKIIPDPQDKKVKLPFSEDRITKKLLQSSYVKKILEKGNSENKISWEKHIKEINNLFIK